MGETYQGLTAECMKGDNPAVSFILYSEMNPPRKNKK